MRLFIAINFTAEFKDGIWDIMTRLREHALEGRFTRYQNLHLTLQFLGETDRVRHIFEAMEEAAREEWQRDEGAGAPLDAASQSKDVFSIEPFVIKTAGLGKFRRRGGDIYWLGLERSAPLEDLQALLARALTRRGFQLEERPFRPHLTLGREVRVEEGFDEEAFSRRLPRLSMEVNRISLMESSNRGGKLTYTEIRP